MCRIVRLLRHAFVIVCVALMSSTISGVQFITREELLHSAAVYSSPGLRDYELVLLQPESSRIFTGPRDHVIELRHENGKLEEVWRQRWSPSYEQLQACGSSGRTEADCENAIKVLQLEPATSAGLGEARRVLVCGTYAFSPKCAWFKGGSKQAEVSGRGMSPFDPTIRNVALWTSNGSYISGSSLNPSGSDFALYLWPEGRAEFTPRTHESPKWFNEPEFIGAFEIGRFSYFFFTESAIELEGCNGGGVKDAVRGTQPPRLPRVARVCTSDRGIKFPFVSDWFWTSFAKATLNCSLPPDDRGDLYQFTQLVAVDFEPHQQLVYALFNTHSSHLRGSAVCAFSAAALDEAFAGNYRTQVTQSSYWSVHEYPFHAPDRCQKMRTDRDLASEGLQTLLRYQLADSAVQPLFGRPLHHSDTERWQHLAVQQVQARSGKPYVMSFLSTSQGSVQKYSRAARSLEACLVEEMQVTSEGNSLLRLVTSATQLLVGTRDSLLSVPVARCSRYQSEIACIEARDPYCGWFIGRGQCLPLSAQEDQLDEVQQHLNGCPGQALQVAGGWGAWSAWRRCSSTEASCLCKRRECDSPPPQYGGALCTGDSVQVSNCTVHGAWSGWLPVGVCSGPSCGEGSGVQRYQRSCTAPSPRHGGASCTGSREELRPCDVPCCLKQEHCGETLQWGAWSSWSLCSQPCGGGYRKRQHSCSNDRRKCRQPHTIYGKCNTQPCTPGYGLWSGWKSYGDNERARTRSVCFRFEEQQRKTCIGRECRLQEPLAVASAPCTDDCDSGLVKGEQLQRVQSHLCAGQPCVRPDVSERGSWQPWSDWQPCSVTCGTGSRSRTRVCASDGGCLGDSSQTEACTQRACIREAMAETGRSQTNTQAQFPVTVLVMASLGSFLAGALLSLLVLLLRSRYCGQQRQRSAESLKNINRAASATPNLYASHSDSARYMSLSGVQRATDCNEPLWRYTPRQCVSRTSNSGGTLTRKRLPSSHDDDYNRDSLMRTNLSLDDL